MSGRRLGAVLVVAVCLCATGTAGAMTLSYSGAVTPSDPTMTPLPFTFATSTCASVTPSSTDGTPSYDAYALRNVGATDCVSVGLSSTCGEPVSTTTYAPTFAPKDAGTGIVGGFSSLTCNASVTHQATIPGGGTFVVSVNASAAATTTTPYTLFVTGTALAPANAINVKDGALPKGNTVNLRASSLKDGSAVEGTVSLSASGGQSYSGPVSCLRVDGDHASLLINITGGNAPAKFAGAVFWLEEQPTGFGAQRNQLLTAAQLARFGGACPNPNAPIGGSFRAMTAGYASVIDTPAPAPPV